MVRESWAPPAPTQLPQRSLPVRGDPGRVCALPVASAACFLPFRSMGLWTYFLKNKKSCNLVLVDELQAGLAQGDIYLSVYLKEVWFNIVSLDLFYLLCV